MQKMSFQKQLRMRVGALVVDSTFRSLAKIGKLHPNAQSHKHGVEVIANVPYNEGGHSDHLLDIYRPIERKKLLPVVFYVHGGGFRILSKDTHWVMALAFARQGYVVFNINYRLAPRHPFPAGLTDAAEALAWVVANATRFGGDPNQLILAGESAGANLVTALTVANCYERPEPWAKSLFNLNIAPRAVLPACGIFQVTDVERFARRKKLSPFLADRLEEVRNAYLSAADANTPGGLELADPLCVIESQQIPVRNLPPFFLGVGTADPLLDDTRRLKSALDRLKVPSEVEYYPGELHAFHALVWRPNARQFWKSSLNFIAKALGEPISSATALPQY